MGAIDLASVKVPKNTKDGAIDLVTRQYLFEKGLNFKHGTGHGIGVYLKVCKFKLFIKNILFWKLPALLYVGVHFIGLSKNFEIIFDRE